MLKMTLLRILLYVISFIFIVHMVYMLLREQNLLMDLTRMKVYSGQLYLSSHYSNLDFSSLKPWFMKDGGEEASFDTKLALWPEDDRDSDRVINQLMALPQDYPSILALGKLKKILLYPGWSFYSDTPVGRTLFHGCPVNTCEITLSLSEAETADAIFFDHYFTLPNHIRPPHQVWIQYILESPFLTPKYDHAHLINWTSTYRHESEIVRRYGKFVPYPLEVRAMSQGPLKNHAEGKTKKVAWMVSNCSPHNQRSEYAHELAKYIEVDIFGKCGTKSCLRKKAEQCLENLGKRYKFYLAFENANCREYITEKFFTNSLENNMLPIAMGAPPDYYEKVAPKHSFLHVDHFQSPKDLADFLHVLDSNDTLYNEYFRWKSTGELINTQALYWCQVCTMLHRPPRQSQVSHSNFNRMWKEANDCVPNRWIPVNTTA